MRQEPITVCAENPHYFAFGGKPVVLVTSAEHYGAVVNGDFEYVRYLDALARWEMNYTRIYAGAYTERKDTFITGNTLGPEPGRLLLPWARSGGSGRGDGGGMYDLERWDESYFSRLRDFIREACRRGIFVEVCLFNCQYPESWQICPLNARNNVQRIGRCGPNDAQTLRDEALLAQEIRYARKITAEAGEFDNVILEVCDEPTLKGTPADEAVAWIGRIADAIREEERLLGRRHLLAQQLELGVDFTADDRFPVIVTQYIRHNETRQVGGVEGLETEYLHDKPIELNETAYYPIWYSGDGIASSRVEAWEFMVGGGAAYNHLNGLFIAADPAGDTSENNRILLALRSLKRFIEGFAFPRMRRDEGCITGGLPGGAAASAMSEPGRQYAIYLHHGVLPLSKLAYEVTTGDRRARMELRIPEGAYDFQWISPEDGSVLMGGRLTHAGGAFTIEGPVYGVDIALRLTAV
jgi:hypothetical protein